MITDSDLQELRRSAGDITDVESHNGVVDAIARRGAHPGKGVRVRQLDNCRIYSYDASGPAIIAHHFKPRLDYTDAGKLAIRFDKGTVNGIEPVIGEDEKKISEEDSKPLELVFGEEGESFGYIELTLNDGWRIVKAQMVSYGMPEPLPPWKARKLAAVVTEDGHLTPALFFNQAFSASQRKASGRAKHWWRTAA